MNDSLLLQQVDERLREYLRGARKNGTHNRLTILTVFLKNTKQVTSKELHYQVKAVNHNISWHCINQTLGLLVQSGLAKVIIPDDGTARLYTHEIAIAKCTHSHLICKDCGAIVQHRAGDEALPPVTTLGKIAVSMEEEHTETLT